MRRTLLAAAIGCVLASCGPSRDELLVTSPDGGTSIELRLDEQGSLLYRVRSDHDEALEWSVMGMDIRDSTLDFNAGLTFVKKEERVIDEEYRLPIGKTSRYVNKANEATFSFKNRSRKSLQVVCRAYDDGVAFRYVVDAGDGITVLKERTTFRLPANTLSWMMDYVPHYENFYPERLLDTVGGQPLSFPALTRVRDQIWMLITEASVFDQPATHMRKTGRGNELVIELPEEQYTVHSKWESPWRTFIIGRGLSRIVESVMVENLNPPSVISEMSWIKPGVAVFPWWGNFLANSSIDTLKMYVDLAAEMHWEWIEFDVSLVGSPFRTSKLWETTSWLPEFTAYARSKGVNVYGWDEMRVLQAPEGRTHVYSKYNDLGIAGIKIDFIESDRQDAMRFRTDATRDAADKKLMVSFHGETAPRGQRRTYPNVMTLEGVKGAEYYALQGYAAPTPVHNCTLPFTRNVVGPMDYTPVTFTIRKENPRSTTYAHELALGVIVESGWLVMADRPEAYRRSPAKDLMKHLESTWDETKFLDGYPGDFVCLARRKDDSWFVAGINAGGERDVGLRLNFLEKGAYSADIFEDKPGEEMTNISIRSDDVGRDGVLTIRMATNGGFVARIYPKGALQN